MTFVAGVDVTDSYGLNKPMTSSNGTGVFDRYTWAEFLAVHDPLALQIDRTVTPLWYVVGLVGNTLSTCVWIQRRMWSSNSSAVYLATISIADLIFLLLHILQELKYAWSIEATGYPVMCELYSVAYMATQYISPTLVLGFTVERYIAVCHPFVKERFCTVNGAVRVTASLVVCCTALASAQAYYWSYDWTTAECQQRTMAAGLQSTVWTVWSWLTEMMVFLVIPLVTLAFNICVVREVRRISTGTPLIGSLSFSRSSGPTADNHQLTPVPENSSSSVRNTLQLPQSSGQNQSQQTWKLNRLTHSNENSPRIKLSSVRSPAMSSVRGGSVSNDGPSSAATTVMLLSVSFYVIATTLPATLVYVLESEFPEGDLAMTDPEILTDPTWRRYLAYILSRKIVEEVCLSHYACNVILYMVTGRHFRSALFDMLRCGRIRRRNPNEYSALAAARATFTTTMF